MWSAVMKLSPHVLLFMKEHDGLAADGILFLYAIQAHQYFKTVLVQLLCLHGVDHQHGHNNKKELFHRVKTFNITATCRW